LGEATTISAPALRIAANGSENSVNQMPVMGLPSMSP
jgi:hypothetical protein